MKARKKSTLPGSPSLAAVYADMVQILGREMGEKALASLLSDAHASGVSESLPLGQGEDILRLLLRLGWLKGLPENERVKRAEDILREFAEAVDRTPAVVSVVFRVYADGFYGDFSLGICGNPPRCDRCALTRLCSYYNAPPSPSRRDKTLTPEERLRMDGSGFLTEEELLALVIGSGKAAPAALAVAGELLGRYGSLRKLARATAAELERYASVKRPTAMRILSAFALSGRMADENRRIGPMVRSGKDFYDLFHKRLRDLRQEVFLVVLLDQRNRVLRDEQVSQGTLTASLVHPREVFAPAIREAAAAVALVHNHPSGDSSPSGEDRAITRRLGETARVLGIRFLDHVIIGENSFTSFVDEHLL
ncbi:MAG: DNA repair protein RadC [Planctomycetota bacterium]